MMFSSLASPSDLAEWYVVRVIAGTEEAVKESLLQRRGAFGLTDHILEVFVPLHDAISVNAKGTKITRKKNIFPGYILVRMIVTNESWYIVRNTPNVTGFLGAGTVPVPVSGDELERLKGALESKNDTFIIKIQKGEVITMKGGPFQWSEGRVIHIDENRGKVKVEINILGRDTPVEVDISDIAAKK